jgi:hypothetical protein
MEPLDMKCSVCGAEPGQPCVDTKTGEPYPPHRGRAIAAQAERDAPALRIANAAVVAREPRQVGRVRPSPEKAAVQSIEAEEPPIALGVVCPNCGAASGQPCVDRETGESREAPCRIRKQAALGHSTEGV